MRPLLVLIVLILALFDWYTLDIVLPQRLELGAIHDLSIAVTMWVFALLVNVLATGAFIYACVTEERRAARITKKPHERKYHA